MMNLLRSLILLLSTVSLYGQSIEPRLYTNAPIDTSFLVFGYVLTNGTLPDNPEILLKNAKLNVHSAVAAYAHVFELFGQSAKVDVIIPTVNIDGNAIYQNNFVTRDIAGLGDIKARISYNLYGAPALSLNDYLAYKQDLIVGISVQVTAPTGKYENQKLVNIGANRWAIKPSIGISKAIDNIVLEFSSAVELYSDNNSFFGNNKRAQEPIYSTQAHIIYNFSRGVWIGLNSNYYWGGETIQNGINSNNEIKDSRFGVTFSMPVNKTNSIKIYANSGVYTRTATDFDMLGVTWQYRF